VAELGVPLSSASSMRFVKRRAAFAQEAWLSTVAARPTARVPSGGVMRLRGPGRIESARRGVSAAGATGRGVPATFVVPRCKPGVDFILLLMS
jgi:hypothetical protein